MPRVINISGFSDGLGGGGSIDPSAPLIHGSSVSMPSTTGANTLSRAFAKPLVDATALGATPVSAEGFNFSNTLGYPLVAVNDTQRG
jgi:hypothetical protein